MLTGCRKSEFLDLAAIELRLGDCKTGPQVVALSRAAAGVLAELTRVTGSPRGILEGLDEILTVIRLFLPHELRRSLACTNIIENALGTVRQVTRNVKRWRNAEMALR